MSTTLKPKADVLLVTVTDGETDAVRDVLHARFERSFSTTFIGDKTYRNLGVIGGARTFLVRSEMGTVGVGGALLTIQAGIEALEPAAIILLGIAFGIDSNRQQVGDILVSRQLMLYDLQRVGTDSAGSYQIRPRGDRPAASSWLVDRFRAGRDDWRGPAIHVGLILSGDKLVDNQDFRDQLQQLEPDAIGGDMEGAGLYVASHIHKVDWIMIKAISDWADGKKQQKDQTQQMAARNAAEFVFHVIQQGGLVRRSASPGVQSSGVSTFPGVQSPGVSTGSPAQLRLILSEGLTNDDVRMICFDLGFDPDDLPGDTKAGRVRELISYLNRRSKLPALYAWLQQHRPDIDLS